MAKIWVLQNAQPENLGIIAQIVQSYGITAEYVRTFAGEPVPRYMDGAVGLIVLGGPMSVYENNHYPFLNDAMRLIDQAIKEQKPVLGICLGSQLLAATLGANVYPNKEKEIGWHSIKLAAAARDTLLGADMAPSCMGFHWHSDIFDLPDGAKNLASSALTPHQAFSYATNVYGVLFHMEVTRQIVGDMVDQFAAEVHALGLSTEDITAGCAEHIETLNNHARLFYQNWAALCLQN